MRSIVFSALVLAGCTSDELTFQPICTFAGAGGDDLPCTAGTSGVGSPHDPMRWGAIADDKALLDEDLVVHGSGACVAPTWTGWLTERTDQLGIIESAGYEPTGHCDIWIERTRDQREVGRLGFDLRAPDHLTTVAMNGVTAIAAPAGYDQAWTVAAGSQAELDVQQLAGAAVVMGVPTLTYDDPDDVTQPGFGGSELFLVPSDQHGDHAVVVHDAAFGLTLRVLIRVP